MSLNAKLFLCHARSFDPRKFTIRLKLEKKNSSIGEMEIDRSAESEIQQKNYFISRF